jgi:PAS domain S-box-containing protein
MNALRESEERFRLVANSAPVLIWMSGLDKLCTFVNQGWLDFTGRSIEQELGQGWASGVHPDDLERCLGTYSAAFDSRVQFEMEYRLRRFDGKYRWIVDYGVPRFERNRAFLGYIGSCVDITDRKLSEDALLDLSGRLITAHEEERARIARELHDDLSQRMALLQIGLAEFEQETSGLKSIARTRLHNIAEMATEVSSDLHNLSHKLHPSKLDSLGLVAAVGGFCREFSKQHALHVQFSHHHADGRFPKDVTLCLFRIVQEALRNVVKHSGAAEARVELSGRGDEIELTVSDFGSGFDTETNKGMDGIGFISMRERVRLVGGHLSIESEPTRGTQIRVRVPLTAKMKSAGIGGRTSSN